jgi:hypothetical protein
MWDKYHLQVGGGGHGVGCQVGHCISRRTKQREAKQATVLNTLNEVK